MAEYIDREEVIDKLTMLFPLLKKRTIKSILKAVPSADVQPVVHGEWIKVGSIENTWLVSKCSACGAQTIDAGCYCSNCGADMRGNDDG